jgi:formylglycine-generating enzyme required for sulfatase activity
MNKVTLLSLMFALLFSNAHANNISVSNVQIMGQDNSAGSNNAANFTMVQFDLSWENSWRNSSGTNNWDAAWVFVKYRINNGAWQHTLLNGSGHTAPFGSTIEVGLRDPGSTFDATANPGIGAFIYRSSNGSGTFSPTGIQLRWNYGRNGVPDDAFIDVQVFAIEMVYVPQGSFYVGDGTSSFIYGHFRNGSTNTPLRITSESAITLGGTSNGNLANNNATGMVTADDFNDATTQVLPASYPKGFKGFYCMKYEITQQQYVDFLNSLTRSQQNARTATNLAPGVTNVANRLVLYNSSSYMYRNGISCNATIDANNPIVFYCDFSGNGRGGDDNDGQWLACNLFTYMNFSAYLDWSGLRPMTELEFEKAGRGPLTAVTDAYAWGSTVITKLSTLNIGNQYRVNESSNTAGANAVFDNNLSSSVDGPVRVGIFATGTSTREQSGASYYGIMELSGNLTENVVTVGNATGRNFTGVHGNGVLSINGNADESFWPGNDGSEVTGSNGSGVRGGSFSTSAILLRFASRREAANNTSAINIARAGRGVRSAP